MKKIMSLLFLFISFSSMAQSVTLPSGYEGKTKTDLKCVYHSDGTGWAVTSKVYINFAYYGEGKARVVLSVEGRELYENKSVSFFAIDNGFGAFNLYSDTNRQVSDGELILLKKGLSIQLSRSKRVAKYKRYWCELAENIELIFDV